ncbi:eukaryotic translation initiation factor 2-alpha kinase 1-like [Hydra vulgaris]|uniref:Eukaryotic translation initiation factor 2-alpha kinase 1-like n=1 Tax=Hydra vulgaris TaxID=6087 RepID=A0ABM4CFH2_HYDVU
MIKMFQSKFFRKDDEKKMVMISQNQSLKEESKTKHNLKVTFQRNKLFKMFLRNKIRPMEESETFKYEPSDAREVEESLDSRMKDSSSQNTFQQEKKKKNKKINFWKLFHRGNKTNKEKKNVESTFYANIFEKLIENDEIDTIDKENLIENNKINIINNENFIENDGIDIFDRENYIENNKINLDDKIFSENDKIDIIDDKILSENDNDLSFDSFYSCLDEIYMDSITYLSQIDSFDLFEKEKDFEFIHDIESVESLNIENINQSSSYTFSDSDDEFVSDFVSNDVLNSTLQLASLDKEIWNSTSIINTIDTNNDQLQCEINEKELLLCENIKKELLQCENIKKELLQCENIKKELLQCENIKKELLQCENIKKELLQCEIIKKDSLH